MEMTALAAGVLGDKYPTEWQEGVRGGEAGRGLKWVREGGLEDGLGLGGSRPGGRGCC